MARTIIDQWSSYSAADTRATVLPDGCRDVIVAITSNQSAEWRVSPYFSTAMDVRLPAGTLSHGLRLAAGTAIDEENMLEALRSEPYARRDAVGLVEEFTSLSTNLSDALACIQSNPVSIESIARKLGVHIRTLQRLISKETLLPPSYWMRLSRVQQAGRLIANGSLLIDVASSSGYSDQSHLTRECVAWFGVTPGVLAKRPDLSTQLAHAAFS